MGRVILAVYTSVDGIQVLDENPVWTAPYWNDEIEDYQREPLDGSDALLLGRKTYEGFADSWSERTNEDDPFAERINTMPKYVASRSLTTTKWNATLLEGDAVEAVKKLKQPADGDLLVYGGGEFADTLIENDLIDEYRLMVHPVVLGTGKRLFADGSDKQLDLIDAKTTSKGVALLAHTPAEPSHEQGSV